MAKNETKHKSKYTAPKDMAKSLKPETRKDLKDYIKDLVRDCMWEFSGEIQPGLRKDDKWDKGAKSYPFVHNNADGKDEAPDMVPNRKDADTAYPIKMMQDGDPKMAAHAKKAFEKNIENDANDYLEAMAQRNTGEKLKENIEKLSESQKEQLVRKYIRNKIATVLQEQITPPAEDPLADQNTETAVDPMTGNAPAEAEPEVPTEPEVSTEPEVPTEPVEDPSPEQEKEEKQKVLLDKIKNSPKEFADVLDYFREGRKDEKLVTLGMKPLLDTINNIENQSEYEAVLNMIKDEINQSRKKYRQTLLQKSQDIPTSDTSDLA